MAKIFRDMKGYAKYDKSFICLPRQYTGNSLKSAYFQRIFRSGICGFTQVLHGLKK